MFALFYTSFDRVKLRPGSYESDPSYKYKRLHKPDRVHKTLLNYLSDRWGKFDYAIWNPNKRKWICIIFKNTFKIINVKCHENRPQTVNCCDETPVSTNTRAIIEFLHNSIISSRVCVIEFAIKGRNFNWTLNAKS